MGIVAVFLLVVAALRVTNWRSEATRLYTIALVSLGAGYLCADSWVGDKHIDPFCASLGLGDNVSELAHGVCLAVACWLFGLMWLLPIAHRPSLRSRYSIPYRWELYWQTWSGFSAAVAVLNVIAHRMSGAPDHPAENMLVFRNVWGSAYIAALAVHVVVTAVIVLIGSVVVMRRSGQRGTIWSMAASGLLGIAVLAYVAGLVNWLLMAPDPHQADMVRQSVAAAVLVILGVLGLGGVDVCKRGADSGGSAGDGSAAAGSGPDAFGSQSVDVRLARVGWRLIPAIEW